MIGIVTVATWAELAVPLLVVIGWVAHWIGGKVDRVGEHLERQDRRGRRQERRMIRVEATLGLEPLPPSEDDQ